MGRGIFSRGIRETGDKNRQRPVRLDRLCNLSVRRREENFAIAARTRAVRVRVGKVTKNPTENGHLNIQHPAGMTASETTTTTTRTTKTTVSVGCYLLLQRS